MQKSVTVISFFVIVPVLSEQMTLTAPSVSTVFRDFARSLFFFIIPAVMVRLAVTAIGRPSGMNATAMETQSTIRIGTDIQPGWSFRSQAAQTMMTRRIMEIMRAVMTPTKNKISFWRGVRPCLE